METGFESTLLVVARLSPESQPDQIASYKNFERLFTTGSHPFNEILGAHETKSKWKIALKNLQKLPTQIAFNKSYFELWNLYWEMKMDLIMYCRLQPAVLHFVTPVDR